ncbi:MAG: carboxyl transferase domain-containing protein [Myxococcota bacterium]|jgi:acetyl-CoA carboxylase carboxyltransferase component|nr:carboxyl transferase domain-containing protein [Myxococcota bacterium]
MSESVQRYRQESSKALQGGGAEAIKKQHAKGRLTARERIDALADPGSFVELDRFMSTRCHDFGLDKKQLYGDGVVTGQMRVNGQKVFVSSQDFTVMGGALGEAHSLKMVKVLELAAQTGAPFISINDSGGARIQEGVDSLEGYGRIFRSNTLASGVIPQISLILGPCAGGAVYSPGITDFVYMVKDVGQMFITGPEVIKAVTGEEVSFETLGGARVHSELSGVAHFELESEKACFQHVRRLLSFLPSNFRECAPRASEVDEPPSAEQIDAIVPENAKASFDVCDFIHAIVDRGEFLEVHERFARNVVVGFGRFDGHTVGIVANQPAHLSGALDIDASDKMARFVRFCDAFNIPLLTLVDVPGFLPGVDQEHHGIIRHGAKVLYAFSEATVPKVSLILRKAYGGAFVALCSRAMAFDRVLALPSAQIAVMGPEGAVNILYRREIAAADDKEGKRREYAQAYEEKFASPYAAAKIGAVDNVIEANQARRELCAAFEMLRNKRPNRVARHHGNIPL